MLNAKTIFHSAEHMHEACLVLEKLANRGQLNLLFASVILAPLSLELYFKALIAIEGGSVPRNHDLRKLFDRISSAHQSWIRTYSLPGFEKQNKQASAARVQAGVPSANAEVTFDVALDASKNAFENLRYKHERQMEAGEGWFAGPMVFATRKLILELHPEWSSTQLTSQVR